MKILFFIIAIPIVLFYFIRFLEQKSLYFPFREIEASPRDLGLAFEDVALLTEDGVRIAGWYVPSASPRATILFSHGNGGNISHRLEKIRILHDLSVAVFIFDYRGYGASEGRPSEQGLYQDGEAAYTWLVDEKKIPPRRIIGYGESLGTAVVVDMAAKHPIGGLVIEGGFTSVRDMAGHYLPFIPRFFVSDSFNSAEKIAALTVPKLHFHSPGDEVVPFKIGKTLYERAAEPKELAELRGGHNDAFLVSEAVFRARLDSFLSTVNAM